MTITELQERFAMPGMLAFEETPAGLIAVHITAPDAAATIYLQGAHIAHWEPTGHAPVLFLSAKSDLAPGKPIRGGIPVIFPWFGPRSDGRTGPAHGFARTSDWELAFAALVGGEMHLTFTLAPNEASRGLGFDHFKVACRVTVGRNLTIELTVANDFDAVAPLAFEEALHTYFAVSDVRQATLTGLAGTTYIDKRDEFKRKIQPDGPMHLTATTDRVYLDTDTTCIIADPPGGRKIVVEKSGSNTTVVWNPWAEVAATLPDMDATAWPEMLCVETANAGEAKITLEPGHTHTMRAHISIEPLT